MGITRWSMKIFKMTFKLDNYYKKSIMSFYNTNQNQYKPKQRDIMKIKVDSKEIRSLTLRDGKHSVAGIRDIGCGVIQVFSFKPSISKFFLEIMAALKKENPDFKVTSHQLLASGTYSESFNDPLFVELTINFEEKNA